MFRVPVAKNHTTLARGRSNPMRRVANGEVRKRRPRNPPKLEANCNTPIADTVTAM
jgi:hypothetical protein